jgi:hypothetical protein
MSLLNLSARAWLRAALSAAAPLVLLAMTGCDSSSRVENYVPTRVMSFGDELSTIESTGRKHSVNGYVAGTTTVDCTVNPIWNQVLATNFGMAFTACPGSGLTVNGVMAASAGATVDTIDAAISAQQTTNAAFFVPTTLVTVQGGLHDVLSAYATFKLNSNRDAAIQLLVDKGGQLAAAINRVTNAGSGARVIYATVPDLGYSPQAITDQAGNATLGTVCAIDCKALLSELTAAFNSAMRTGLYRRLSDDRVFTAATGRAGVLNDGRYAALVTFDDTLRSMANPAFSVVTYGLTNNSVALSDAACVSADLLTCEPVAGSLVAGALAATNPSVAYLWAGATLPGPNWHGRVAAVAITRARNNPF